MNSKKGIQHDDNLPLDLNNMPSMDELLGEGGSKSGIEHPDPADICSKNRLHKSLSFFAVNTNDMPTMDTLLSNNTCTESACEKNERSIEKSMADRKRKRKPDLRKSAIIKQIGHMRFVIDGSNVCRSYSCLNGISSLAPLLTLTLTLVKHNAKFQCVFDANEHYMLGKNSSEPENEIVYEKLLNSLSRFFIEVPGATDADDFILSSADRDYLQIISNDRFNKLDENHQSHYPWLQFGTKRILKGTVDNNRLIIGQLGINVPLEYDLNQSFKRLADRLRPD